MQDFIDEATIAVSAGAGGDGCVSFRREKFAPRGGPDGGDGGRGGDVAFVGDRNLATLGNLQRLRRLRAEAGRAGGGNNRSGRRGKNLEIPVPLGTTISDRHAQPGAEALVDITAEGERCVVARGGRGGWGNARFATPTRQTPDFAYDGRPGESQTLHIALKLLADVGLVGLPNAGKSTLLRRLSEARPRVGAYPFTTLQPVLGAVESGEHRFVVADIPGLIEGASQGQGLGDRFLRHIERTRVLVHLVDVGNAVLESRDPLDAYRTIRDELGHYQPSLLGRIEVVALTKVDLVAERAALDSFERTLRGRGREVRRISASTGEGVEALLQTVSRALQSETAA